MGCWAGKLQVSCSILNREATKTVILASDVRMFTHVHPYESTHKRGGLIEKGGGFGNNVSSKEGWFLESSSRTWSDSRLSPEMDTPPAKEYWLISIGVNKSEHSALAAALQLDIQEDNLQSLIRAKWFDCHRIVTDWT